jgi:5-methyltetrahydrofolate--homocysteine methyltransferase
MDIERFLQTLEDGVAARDITAIERMVGDLDFLPAEPSEILQALCRGIERVRQNFASQNCAIPDLLLSIDCYHAGANWVKRLATESLQEEKPSVVIGVVEGDVHHMGKNIVAAVLSASGYHVHDAGRDVANRVFLDMITQTGAAILALSVMMSTPQDNMAELIRMVRLVSPQTLVIVGGASMDMQLAHIIGADGYAETAVTVPQEFSRVLSMHAGAHGQGKSVE